MRRLLTLNNQGKLSLQPASGTETSAAKRRNALLLIDMSRSMGGIKIEQARSAAIKFARFASLSSYATAVAAFGDRAAMVCDPTTDAGQFERSISRLEVGIVGRNSNLADGLILAKRFVDLAAVIIVTDGQCNDGEIAILVAGILKSRGVEIICIGTDDADIDILSKIATRLESTEIKLEAEEGIKEINEAYSVLSHTEIRLQCDQQLAEYRGPISLVSPSPPDSSFDRVVKQPRPHFSRLVVYLTGLALCLVSVVVCGAIALLCVALFGLFIGSVHPLTVTFMLLACVIYGLIVRSRVRPKMWS